MEKEQENEINDSPIEEVRLTVPVVDDKTLPALTFRALVLGLSFGIFLSFQTQFFAFRQSRISISSIFALLLAFPIGKLMERTLPTKSIRIPGTILTFSMNPGPFNVKEHVLINMFAAAGTDNPYALLIVPQARAFYHRKISPWAILLLTQTTQMLGYGFAGLFIKFLVESPYMWWPSNLVDVSFFRALHDVEERKKGQLTRYQFLVIVIISSFTYYLVPGYLFPSLTSLSFACLIWKDSVTAQQIGSGLRGLGLGSFSLDWATIVSFLGNPLAYPISSIINNLIGFLSILYIIIPITYWTNSYDAKRFPIFSARVFDANGQEYNVSCVLDDKEFKFNQQGYDHYSKIHMGVMRLFSFGFGFALVTATIAHVVLFHGRDIWDQVMEYRKGEQKGDIHNKLMKDYDPIPQWWFYIILVLSVGLGIFACEGFGGQLQLPFWGVLLACLLAFIFILPIGIIQATTNQGLQLNIVTELIMGYIYPGKPLAYFAFKSYGMESLFHTLVFLSDLKMGHYMKIPPRSIFFAKVVGMLVSSSVNFGTIWWLFSSVENICNPSKLPKGSPWTCPSQQVIYSTTGVWGIVGPGHVFAPHGLYSKMYLFFLVGIVGPLLVWILSQLFPKKKWIQLINFPLIMSTGSVMPPVTGLHVWSWCTLGILFNYVIYNKYRGWWSRYNYVLSTGLDVGVALMALLTSLALPSVFGPSWWGLDLDDHCTLAHCPTAPGIEIAGCPFFQ